ncbi:immunoglobulin A1 protease autotransporter-like [Ptychodera flava]|uniref:immunoglobulin A1 protease autotransporter-like n=1 Tax=Ptychodera flava TaxID=63121 RepID=UPI00396A73C5
MGVLTLSLICGLVQTLANSKVSANMASAESYCFDSPTRRLNTSSLDRIRLQCDCRGLPDMPPAPCFSDNPPPECFATTEGPPTSSKAPTSRQTSSSIKTSIASQTTSSHVTTESTGRQTTPTEQDSTPTHRETSTSHHTVSSTQTAPKESSPETSPMVTTSTVRTSTGMTSEEATTNKPDDGLNILLIVIVVLSIVFLIIIIVIVIIVCMKRRNQGFFDLLRSWRAVYGSKPQDKENADQNTSAYPNKAYEPNDCEQAFGEGSKDGLLKDEKTVNSSTYEGNVYVTRGETEVELCSGLDTTHNDPETKSKVETKEDANSNLMSDIEAEGKKSVEQTANLENQPEQKPAEEPSTGGQKTTQEKTMIMEDAETKGDESENLPEQTKTDVDPEDRQEIKMSKSQAEQKPAEEPSTDGEKTTQGSMMHMADSEKEGGESENVSGQTETDGDPAASYENKVSNNPDDKTLKDQEVGEPEEKTEAKMDSTAEDAEDGDDSDEDEPVETASALAAESENVKIAVVKEDDKVHQGSVSTLEST